MKRDFLLSQAWASTIRASFGRIKIYKEGVKAKEKLVFKEQLYIYVHSLVDAQYKLREVNEVKHIQNIKALIYYSSSRFSELLSNKMLCFGVGQKLLNLYLKYLWCLEYIPTPPHFPVDRIIQNKLGINPPFNWTTMTDKRDYLIIISRARELMKKKDFKSLADLELSLYE